ncbi:MAG TPA: hypothetical protein VH540_00840 [Ktedonobacterales bacterium]|jgi:hypothetical protein
MNTLLLLALGWLLVLVVFLSFLALLRYLDHRERMAMILRGITPPDKRHNRLPRPTLVRRTVLLQGGLITAMVGLALTVGLYPLGYILPPSLVAPYHLGPWLLAGLIPLAVGGALILGHYLTPGRPLDSATRPATEDTSAEAKGQQAVSGNQSQRLAARSAPLALPEARRRTWYQRQASGAAEPLPEGDEPAEGEE